MIMTDLEKRILNSLVELQQAVRAKPTGPKTSWQSLFARLDNQTRQLPKSTDPNLLHYLHRKSYEKARLFLQGHDAENALGTCRH
jgi:hypothetical protein